MLIRPAVELKSEATKAAAPLVVPSAAASVIVSVLLALKSPPPLRGEDVDIVLDVLTPSVIPYPESVVGVEVIFDHARAVIHEGFEYDPLDKRSPTFHERFADRSRAVPFIVSVRVVGTYEDKSEVRAIVPLASGRVRPSLLPIE